MSAGIRSSMRYDVEATASDSTDSAFVASRIVIQAKDGFLWRLQNLEAKLDQKFGIESNAIDRKRPEDKLPVKWHEKLNMFFLWASGTMNASCFASGFLGWELGLTLQQAIFVIFFSSVLGSAVTGFSAIFGAATGLRQISVSRYSFGWWPNKVIAALNALVQIGWSAVACITCGGILTAVADGHVSLVVGIIVLAVVALFISFVGLKAVLVYERYAWLIFLIIFAVIFAQSGEYADNNGPSLGSGELSGAVLNLIAIVYGSSCSWCPIASDYYVHYPANINRVGVFLATTFGIAIPTSIAMASGAVAAAALNSREDWRATYENDGVGYLIQAILHPRGLSKLFLTLLVLSGINTNIISLYSSAISFQQLARPFAKIPRLIWTVFCFVIVLALALGGRQQLNAYLQNFLGILGYWCTSYFAIVLMEHFVFRGGDFSNYDLEAWNDSNALPVGIAASAAFLIGIVAWCMGMVQTWYMGPLGKLIGTNGGDVANELTFLVTVVVFIPARWLEKKAIGR
ncbi:permease for cytosine/purines, uracil, thiamine, allantoin-domain-containing protein [Talaromyces proteolyticus]|uniref:Permease for cytosine/purines, uracil, thiamine, allantoin-domain-containing protein n=1 Tax=Talaromyces proteolyticus TaxID=1131652 RepID=A0AAD4Q2I3_9EURO|nr:permease for cytosine/purines, uracil, thiamine, allantoin-domain-containing protein [Talaromyces proteolyticus]KAH8700462.1 permease for cytosine/purines, uracil, thiamine, allantoin-domain-containing protein [Talaromyces proteolyticus]